MKKLDKQRFIEESNKLWGDKYDYSLVEYKDMRNNIRWVDTYAITRKSFIG